MNVKNNPSDKISSQHITFPKSCAVEDMHMDNALSSIMFFEFWADN